jgi:hypothetical protein
MHGGTLTQVPDFGQQALAPDFTAAHRWYYMRDINPDTALHGWYY